MARDIGVDAEIDMVRLKEQGSNPATPDSGYLALFAKTDGLYFKDDSGRVLPVEYQTWTPTWTNITVGDGTQLAKYVQIGRYVFAQLELTFGSTTTVDGIVNLALPVTSEFVTLNACEHGSVIFYDTSTGDAWSGAIFGTSLNVRVLVVVSNKLTHNTAVNATSPFTWATGDKITVKLAYIAA